MMMMFSRRTIARRRPYKSYVDPNGSNFAEEGIFVRGAMSFISDVKAPFVAPSVVNLTLQRQRK
jgi:hypothetical protein